MARLSLPRSRNSCSFWLMPKIGSLFHIIRFLSVAVILAVALTAKIPNKVCKCNHKNKPAKQICPYGELRQVVTCLLEVDLTVFELFSPAQCWQDCDLISELNAEIFPLGFFGRAPPVA